MSDPVLLRVPLDARFRAVGPEVASAFCVAQGGSNADGAALGEAVAATMATWAADAGADADVTMRLDRPDGRVEITIACGSRSSVLSHPLPTH